MTNLPALNETKTTFMPLKEITDLLKVEHNKAMITVAKMAESPEFGLVEIIATKQKTGFGEREIQTYALDKRQSVAVSAKLNTALLMRVIDRWQELENQQLIKLPDFNLPQTLSGALRLAADTQEALESAQLQIEAQKQTIESKDDLIRVSNEASVKAGEILIREFVKSQDLITIGERKFFKWMRDHKIVFSERNEPYQHYVGAGYFTYKPSEVKYGGEFRYTLRVTPRGKVWLAAKYMAYMDSEAFLLLDCPVKRNGLVSMQGALL